MDKYKNTFRQNDAFELELKDFKKGVYSFAIVIAAATLAIAMYCAYVEYSLAYPSKTEVKK